MTFLDQQKKSQVTGTVFISLLHGFLLLYLTLQLLVRMRRLSLRSCAHTPGLGEADPTWAAAAIFWGGEDHTLLNTEDLSLKQACFSNLCESLRHTVVKSKMIPGFESRR